MPRAALIILGNGFTIDFLTRSGKSDIIDVRNLFRYGSNVPWPANNEPGFLSFKRCPNLWNLGARPTMSSDEAMSLVEDIITCVNAYALVPPHLKKGPKHQSNDIYLYAYKELVKYLRHLFVYYDKKLPDVTEAIANWQWANYLKSLNENENITSVKIITFNYDMWLEKTLMSLNVPYKMHLFDGQPDAKVHVLKPHGSISFCHKDELDKSAFEIRRDYEITDGVLQDFTVRHDRLDSHCLIDALIPPAGDAGRYNNTWAGQIRGEALAWIKQLRPGDQLLISGLSYWHVDRAELDQMIVQCNREVDVRMINPYPPRSMNAVLASIFDTYVLHSNTDVLQELGR